MGGNPSVDGVAHPHPLGPESRFEMRRTLFTIAGLLCVGLGAIGVVLPGLPTTPFLLLAAGCFAKGSPRLHGWLLRNRLLGPILYHWQHNRTIPRRAKQIALASLAVVALFSLLTIQMLLLKALIAALLVVPLVILWRLKTVEGEVG